MEDYPRQGFNTVYHSESAQWLGRLQIGVLAAGVAGILASGLPVMAAALNAFGTGQMIVPLWVTPVGIASIVSTFVGGGLGFLKDLANTFATGVPTAVRKGEMSAEDFFGKQGIGPETYQELGIKANAIGTDIDPYQRRAPRYSATGYSGLDRDFGTMQHFNLSSSVEGVRIDTPRGQNNRGIRIFVNGRDVDLDQSGMR